MHNNKKSDLILDSMQKLMLKKDTRSISVSEIAREAGIGKGSIYYYFKSKEEIVDAVIERSYSDAIRQAQELGTGSRPGRADQNGDHLPDLPGFFHRALPAGSRQLYGASAERPAAPAVYLYHDPQPAPYPGRHHPPGQSGGDYLLQLSG